MSRADVVVIGAGIGGLVTAVLTAARGLDVVVLERAATPGGKMREVVVDGHPVDAGPTVMTLREVFDAVFAEAGATLDDHVTLRPAAVLARHGWTDGDRLDLLADPEASAEAIGAFAGPAEADRFRTFLARARAVHATLDETFMRTERPSPFGLAGRVGRLDALWRLSPFSTLWGALGEHFHDPRLRQLFGRYSTYVGSSPFRAPATLMLIAHVEQAGVWLVEGGMHRLARALAGLAEARGARIRYGAHVEEITVEGGRATGVRLVGGERIEARVVVSNADAGALASGRLGEAARRATAPVPVADRSLSALTWCALAETEGFPLARHTVFFSNAYRAEFDAIFRDRRLPDEPTVYVCAQDRDDVGRRAGEGPERLLCLVNAPAIGDSHDFGPGEIERCEERALDLMRRCGLRMVPRAKIATSPNGFEALFPGTGGALYGRASHGWTATFRRATAATRIPGLVLTGGSVHPGAGVPMAALSGRIAAARVMRDLSSIARSRRTAMSGGMSTPSPTTAGTG